MYSLENVLDALKSSNFRDWYDNKFRYFLYEDEYTHEEIMADLENFMLEYQRGDE